MNKIRTAIFGGSFDPIHAGHVALARAVRDYGLADEVWLLVTPLNPHKQCNNLTGEGERLAMARLAIAGETGIVASDFEFHLSRPSYTINTLEALQIAFPDREFVLLMGADNWKKIDKWYKGDEIVSRFGIIVYPRGGEDAPALPENVKWLQAPLYDISSTEIRRAFSQGEDVSQWLHPNVAEYIKKKKLYL
ncbi:MAG: nicotinate-nucleotide adenylyltransferase [Bacteroidales bacterium]|nr:nicotinate-nucleotide adenylyltransferase [Bacteroidales bacterium]